MKNYKIVAVDMDGTLLNNDLKISPRAANAIKEAKEMGVFVTLCTGRMFASAKPYAEELGLNVPLITYNGALVKNSLTEEILYKRCLPLDEAVNVVKKCQKYDLSLNVYVNDMLYVEKITENVKKYADMVKIPVNKVDNLIDFFEINNERPIKMLAIGDEEELTKMRYEITEEGTSLYITSSYQLFLEFLHKEATKGLGLEAAAKNLGVEQDEIIAIGDNENDIEMLKYAGTAVVMENARSDIKRYADIVTKSNDDDGVAEAIENLVLRK